MSPLHRSNAFDWLSYCSSLEIQPLGLRAIEKSLSGDADIFEFHAAAVQGVGHDGYLATRVTEQSLAKPA